MIPYFCATVGFSSTLILPILAFSPIEPAISSKAGAIMRHGPHHSAQKSTTTGLEDLSTSASNVASETLPTPIGHLVVSNRGNQSTQGDGNVWRARRSVKDVHRLVTAVSNASSSDLAGNSISSRLSVHSSAARTGRPPYTRRSTSRYSASCLT